MYTIMQRLRLAASFLLIACGAFMLLGAGINRIERPAEHPWGSTILLALIVGVTPLVYGVILFRNIRKQASKSQTGVMERTVLQLARDTQGLLTAAEVATRSTLSLEEAQQTLNELNLKGINVMDVSDVGIIVYRFADFLPTEDHSG